MPIAAKSEGFVATPPSVARELVGWALRDPADAVLDVGAGEGVFLRAAASRLLDLGASRRSVGKQLFGVERDPGRFAQAVEAGREAVGLALPGLTCSDLFATGFPQLAAVVGNPPYVRRNSLDEIDRVRHRLTLLDPFLPARIGRLADLYSYFLIYAAEYLKNGGRMAVIISSSWMDTDYGIGFKEFLLRTFAIRMVAVTEQRLFSNALVKTVMVFLEKRPPQAGDRVLFVRLPEFREGFSGLDEEALSTVGHVYAVPQKELDTRQPWGIYLRRAEAYFSIPIEKTRPLGDFGRTRIGIQPLARDFYIMQTKAARERGLSDEFLLPLADSPRSCGSAVIKDPKKLPHRILFVKADKLAITSPALLAYIEAAEGTAVSIRGKEETVLGYHAVPRLMATRRRPWYNLVDEINRRGRWPILIPRRFYEQFLVVWNKGAAVANENFIEFEPKDGRLVAPLLAVLNSSFFELSCRSRAQQYGGGVYNLNPLDVRRIPVLDVSAIGAKARKGLGSGYPTFLKNGDRAALDRVVAGAFEIGQNCAAGIQQGLAELRRLSTASKKVAVT